ncbi:MAG: hypothetical protein R8K21_04700 [Mariprofundales bacterium]
MRVKRLSFRQLRATKLADRLVDASAEDFGSPYKAHGSFADFFCTLPDLGSGSDFFLLRDAVATAINHKKGVLLACGGRILNAGLQPLLVRLLEQKVITALCMTGEAMLHDVEVALTGQVLRANSHDLESGNMCITEETGLFINEALAYGVSENWGFGKSIGEKINNENLAHAQRSLLGTAVRLNIPVTVHPSIGADAFLMHPSAHGESIGSAGMRDLQLLAGIMNACDEGVLINTASVVQMPRVLLQAIDAARNLGKPVSELTVACFGVHTDMPAKTIQQLSEPDGKAILLPGAIEIMLPLLFAAVEDAIN